jgi:ABC-type transport system involved in multi-copper enzyme maturation permease subunit
VSALLSSELLKIRTVRTFLWLALGSSAVIAISSISVVASSGQIESAADDRSVARIAAIALVFSLISGIVVMAGEITHGTITQALLVTPARERVVFAKVLIAALASVALAVLAEILVLAITVPGASLDVHNSRRVLLGVLIGAPLAGALGVGFGAIVRSQGSGIGISLVWLLIGENVVTLISERVAEYTPGRAFAALVSGEHSRDLLGMGAGGAVAASWAAVMVAAGLLVFLGRDI